MAMSRDSKQWGRRNVESARIGGRDFWLLPRGEDGDRFLMREQEKAPEPMRFEDPVLKEVPKYEYTRLPSDKKMIRLLKLYSGEASGTEIYCELVEVEYDTEFHVPTRIQEEKGSASESSDKKSTSDKKDDEGERSDLEEQHKSRDEKEDKKERVERKKRMERRALQKVVDDLEKEKQRGEQEPRGTGNDADNREEGFREQKEDPELKRKLQAWKDVKRREEKYEALSWCWGNEEEDYAVLIKSEGRTYKKRVRKELALAMKYLRRPGQERTLWIDAICIDQTNPNERNHQVQMMSRVYTRAQQVCIWLGEADADSDIAIEFIKGEMKELKNFDTLTSDEQYSRKWQALMSLMQRDWFFRRWVVQEIALSSAAMVYCGHHSVPWKSFAVAVELFVEVETATHRLSEVMKRDEKFRHVPGWFEYVSELGASLLVQATGKVFRTKRSPMQPGPGGSDEGTELYHSQEKQKEDEDELLKRLMETQTIDPLERRSLLSLEYLVSTMFIFQASEPRDVVYSLLAIARDASPFAPAFYGQEDQKLFLVMTLLDRFLAEKPFIVDYSRPYSDVSRDFVEFSIQRMYKIDPYQALDILCRPWALDPPRGRSKRLRKPKKGETNTVVEEPWLMQKRKPMEWKKCERKLEENKDGFWEEKERKFKQRYKKDGNLKWVSDSQTTTEQYRAAALKLAKAKWEEPCKVDGCTSEKEADCPLHSWSRIKTRYFSQTPGSNKTAEQVSSDIDLPSWVSRASQAPFMLDHAPGMEMRKTSRANADPLVGAPLDGHRNYNASGSEKLDLAALYFKKRPIMNTYSLYVKGFELDIVKDVEDASQLGSIPKAWLDLGGWENTEEDPPDEFWRTIVADRGRDDRNPPYYYARACKESVHKGSHLGGSVNTAALIHDEQNSIVAEFCRRVRAVIWNRCLFRTEGDRLGLASKVKKGDKVCILNGCTVPVILREVKKDTSTPFKNGEATGLTELELESEEDRIETLKACIRRAVSNRKRKAKYRPQKNKYKEANQWQKKINAKISGTKGGEDVTSDVEEYNKKMQETVDEWQLIMDAKYTYLDKKKKEDDKEDTQRVKKGKEDEERKEGDDFRKGLANEITKARDMKKAAENTRLIAQKTKDDAQKAKEDAQKVHNGDGSAGNKIPDKKSKELNDALQKATKDLEEATTKANEEIARADGIIARAERKADIAAEKVAKKEANEHASLGILSGFLGSSILIGFLLWFGILSINISVGILGVGILSVGIFRGISLSLGILKAKIKARKDAAAKRDNEGGAAEQDLGDESKDSKYFWYEFKGECYLHGMMDGEAIREKFYKDLRDRTFELR
ncbi:hypothetical protein BP6252_08974 [Coleophoma cylindrospora]|uniref:Heterokaryon incompatibility domain-containing protein n=1 Tax=Coleophoma cylindrospora TaxID=1849047 RepID=A0A3D8R0U9_9HELO|nr:hypothetical protein BP6252_08974 [Coleophoma cylindrospora]